VSHLLALWAWHQSPAPCGRRPRLCCLLQKKKRRRLREGSEGSSVGSARDEILRATCPHPRPPNPCRFNACLAGPLRLSHPRAFGWSCLWISISTLARNRALRNSAGPASRFPAKPPLWASPRRVPQAPCAHQWAEHALCVFRRRRACASQHNSDAGSRRTRRRDPCARLSTFFVSSGYRNSTFKHAVGHAGHALCSFGELSCAADYSSAISIHILCSGCAAGKGTRLHGFRRSRSKRRRGTWHA